MKIPKTLVLCTLLCALPTSALLTGCGGGGSGISVPQVPIPAGTIPTLAQLAGNYTATATQTTGDASTGKGGSGTYNVTIDNTGHASGVNPNDSTDTISGTVNASNGKFSFSGGDGGTGTGYFRLNNGVITGTGTFYAPHGDNNNNPAAGTFNFTSVS